MIRHYAQNEAGRDFVVGDIHGCTALLTTLLDEAAFDPEIDRLFSVGDLIDRGPDSMGALALLKQPWFHAVRGNHESMLMQIAADPSPANWRWWIDNGGMWAKGLMPAELQEYAAELSALPLAISVGSGWSRFNVIHAEYFGTDDTLDAGNYDPHTAERMQWGRSRVQRQFTSAVDDELSMTFVGHTVVPALMRLDSHIYIDTGSCFNGVLTLMEPLTGYCWQTVGTDEHPLGEKQ